MQNLYDYKKHALLYVDDEEKSLKYFTRAFEDQFRILTAPSAQEGLKLLESVVRFDEAPFVLQTVLDHYDKLWNK